MAKYLKIRIFFTLRKKNFQEKNQKIFKFFEIKKWSQTSANTLTEDPDIRIIRISEPEASDPYYPDIRIIRISELSGYPNYPDIRVIRIFELSGYPDPDI